MQFSLELPIVHSSCHMRAHCRRLVLSQANLHVNRNDPKWDEMAQIGDNVKIRRKKNSNKQNKCILYIPEFMRYR